MRNICIFCNRQLETRHQIIFCSNKCQKNHEYHYYIDRWKEGKVKGSVGITSKTISCYIRRYLLEKYKSKCSICGWDKVHSVTKKIPLEIDHIDGNSDNNIENTNAEKILKGEREIAEGRGIPHSEVEKLSKNYPLRPNGP